MKVLDPAGEEMVSARSLAPRPGALRGLPLNLLDNSKPNAGILLERLAALLVERAGAGPVRAWRKPGASTAAAPSLLEEIGARGGVVLTGSAD
jgi:hypothetical protein